MVRLPRRSARAFLLETGTVCEQKMWSYYKSDYKNLSPTFCAYVSLCVCVCVGCETLRLIFSNKLLGRDDSLLKDYGIQHNSLIQVVLRLPGWLTEWLRASPLLATVSVCASYNSSWTRLLNYSFNISTVPYVTIFWKFVGVKILKKSSILFM